MQVKALSDNVYSVFFFSFSSILLTSSQRMDHCEISEACLFFSFFFFFCEYLLCVLTYHCSVLISFLACCLEYLISWLSFIISQPAVVPERPRSKGISPVLNDVWEGLVHVCCWLCTVCTETIYGDKNCFAQVAGIRARDTKKSASTGRLQFSFL